jgi:hypothetical protein
MDLGGPDHRYRMAAVQEGVFCGDLVRSVAFPGVVVPRTGPHGRIALEDGRIKTGWDIGIDVVAGGVDVHGLAGEHDGRAHSGQVRKELPCVGLCVADSVDQQVRTSTDHAREGCIVTTVGSDKSNPGGGQAGWHFGPVPARYVHCPAGVD